MKCRNGFVSNSSSSSFLMIGFSGVNKQLYDEVAKLEDGCFYDIVYHSGDEEGYCVGVNAIKFLEQAPLEQAKRLALDNIADNLPEDLFKQLKENYKIKLIYDSYYC